MNKEVLFILDPEKINLSSKNRLNNNFHSSNIHVHIKLLSVISRIQNNFPMY